MHPTIKIQQIRTMLTMPLFLSMLFFTTMSVMATPPSLLLSGQIKAADTQGFYAPKTDSWRVKVQWILPEGEIAKKGDLVVVFDSGAIASQLEQEKVSLVAAKEELHRIKTNASQSILEATFAEKRSALLLEKARIDASITLDHISRYQYEKNQLNFEKSLIKNAKDKESLKQTQLANQVAITKQKIVIEKHHVSHQRFENKLAKMSLYAKREGPVIYSNSPWTGEKIYIGITAQASWKIVEIPSLNDIFIEAWVHEVDYKNLTLGKVAALTFDAFAEQPLTAKLTKISTQPEQRQEWGNDVYFKTIFEFDPNNTLSLLPGMSAQIELIENNNE